MLKFKPGDAVVRVNPISGTEHIRRILRLESKARNYAKENSKGYWVSRGRKYGPEESYFLSSSYVEHQYELVPRQVLL